MLSKNFMLLKYRILRCLDDLTLARLYHRDIKRKIEFAMRHGETSVMWFRSYPEAFDCFEMCVAEYLDNNTNWIKNKKFRIESDNECVTISW